MTPVTNTFVAQVGGDHYQCAEVQHWDFIEANGLGYLEGCATKYIERWDTSKGQPVRDLEKALSYIDKIRLMHLAGLKDPPARTLENFRDGFTLQRYFELHEHMTDFTRLAFRAVISWRSTADLVDAATLTRSLLRVAQERAAASVSDR